MNIWGHSMAALAGLLLFACRQAPEQTAAPQPSQNSSQTIPRLPVAEPPLDREALLLAALHAASAASAGEDDRERQRLLDGKRFELRMRFGCGGESTPQAGSRSWTIDERAEVLRIRVAPEISASTPLLSLLGLGHFEAAEGFWITRPWLLTATCPAPHRGPVELPSPSPSSVPSAASPNSVLQSPTLAPQLGIAQFFTTEDARTHRRNNRAYELTKPQAAASLHSSQGYDLVVSGRLTQVADGDVIACAGENTLSAPSCIISAEFERVIIADPTSGETLGEWAGA